MIAAYLCAAVVALASAAVGLALLAALRLRRWYGLAPAVGLAALVTVAPLAARLPSHGDAAAVSLAMVALAAAVHVLARVRPLRPPWPLVATALVCALAASLPFIVNGRVGVLGAGLVNDDMASHLQLADWVQSQSGPEPALAGDGYPLGPHALVAALASGLGADPIEAFAGLTIAIAVIAGWTALAALPGRSGAARVLAAGLVAVCYLQASYLAQGAFKEPMMALLLVAFALGLDLLRSSRREEGIVSGALALGVIVAGALYTYSFPALFWLVGTAAAWLALQAVRDRARLRAGDWRAAAAPAALAAGVALAVALTVNLPEVGRIMRFAGFKAFDPGTNGLGNLGHPLSPLEALGVWPASDFRLSAADASLPVPAFYLGAGLAAAILAAGVVGAWRRREDGPLAALAAAAVIYAGSAATVTAYASAKALAIVALPAMLLAIGWLLDRTGARAANDGIGRRLLPLLSVAFAGLAAASSFLALRQAAVGPRDHLSQLDRIRPLVAGHDVLFLGRDNFVAWELRGARPFVAVRNYYDDYYVKPNLRLDDVFAKFDFDSVRPATLARFPYVITTRAAYASGPPPAFRAAEVTRDFVLWRREGPVTARRTLPEGDDPGAVLGCKGRRGRSIAARGGAATTFARAPVTGSAWSPSATVESGGGAAQTLRLGRGRWRVSLQYDATQPVHLVAPGLDATVPPNLDYRGSVPYYPAGRLVVHRARPVRFEVTVDRPPLPGRLLGANSVAHLGAIALTPAGPGGSLPGSGERVVPLAHACGQYVDWYSHAGR